MTSTRSSRVAAKTARIIFLSFGVFLAFMALLCELVSIGMMSRHGTFSPILDAFALEPNKTIVLELTIMSIGGFALFGLSLLIHRVVASKVPPG